MGEPRETRKITDDMGGIYTHASKAFEAGRRRGRDDFFRAVQAALSHISADQESGPVNGPGEAVATRGFHVAQACAKRVQELKATFDSANEGKESLPA